METGSPTSIQPKLNDGWRKVTLTVPNGKIKNDGNLGETPVAPPRRKRSSVIDRQPCGFKELFGNNVSRRSSCDSILKGDNPLTEREQEMLQQKRKSKSISDFNMFEQPTDGLSISTIRIPVTRTLSLMERAMVQQTTIPAPRPTLQRKVSRVGNKKSDKFFGENLSDCLSDEPITPEPEPTSISYTYHTISTLITPLSHASLDAKDKLDEFIDSNASASNVVKIQDDVDANQVSSPIYMNIDDKKSSLDKKAEFLMAMLEGNGGYSASSSSDESKVITPPRRSHLKKRNSQLSTNEKFNNSEEKTVEKKTIVTNNNDVTEKNKENNNDDDYYKGMTPVDEPLIIPRTRPIRHICDDDHHIHKHVEHNHATVAENKENQPEQTPMSDADIEKYIIMQVTNPPEKPKRDASVYEKAKKLSNTENIEPIIKNVENKSKELKQLPRVRHLSQENLMSKKILTNKSNDTIDLLRIKTMQKANNNNNDNIDKCIANDGLQTFLKKYSSQPSFFTQELLSQIADRVYGFQDPFPGFDSCDDGSSNCTPHSKLTTRKVSVHRKESNVTRPILENVLEISSTESAPKIVQMEAKQTNANGNEIIMKSEQINGMNEKTDGIKENSEKKENENKIHQSVFIKEQTKRDTETFLSIERDNSEVCDKEDAKINGHIQMDECHIERLNGQSNNLPNGIEKEPKSDQIHANHVLDDIYKKNTIILDAFQKNLNGRTLTVPGKICDKLENLNSSDDDNSDSDITVKEVPICQQTKNSAMNECGGEKRGSIVEVDAWFLKQNGSSELPRRDSENNIEYDTRKVFPFGKSDSGAGSEFFEGKPLSKNAEDILNGNIAKIELTTQQNGNTNETPSTNDHSILLKYLK